MRLAACATILSLLLSALPASFFVAFAATDIYSDLGPVSVDGATPFTSGSQDATGYDGLSFSFDYDLVALDSGDSFTYDVLVSGSSVETNTFPGVNGDVSAVQTITVDLSTYPEAADIELQLSAVTDAANDEVVVTDIVLAGDAVVVACTPQHDAAGVTNIQNSDTGDYFDTIQDAVDDCDTDNGDTISVASGTYTEDVLVNKELTLLGNSASTIEGQMRLTAPNITVDGFTFDGASTNEVVLLRIPGTGNNVSNITITDNVFQNINVTNNNDSAAMTIESSDGTLVEGNVFKDLSTASSPNNRTMQGILVGDTGQTDDLEDITIKDNLFQNIMGGRGAYGIIVNRPTTGLTIIGNTIEKITGNADSTGSGWASGIGLDASTPGALVKNNTVSEVTSLVNGAYAAFGLIGPGQSVASAESITIEYNDFLVDKAGENRTAGSVDYSRNWWGSETGPQYVNVPVSLTPVNAASGNTIFQTTAGGSITYEPWLCGPFATDPDLSVDGECLPPQAELSITNPAVDGETLAPQVVTFTADYTDDDETVDTINWAIKPGSCEANNSSVNLLGFGTPGYAPALYNSTTGEIEVEADLSAFADGDYCFVVNPAETGGQTDTEREVRLFTLATPVELCHLPYVVSFGESSDDDTFSTTPGDTGLVIAEVPGGYTVGLYDDGRDGVYRVQGTIAFPAGTDTATFNFVEAAGSDGLEQTNATYPDVADRSGTTITFDLFVNGADDAFTITADALENEANCDVVFPPVEEPEEATLVITDPDTDGATLMGSHTFLALYTDDDETIDSMQWAIRAGTCAASNGTVAGNVDGFNTPFSWDGSNFSATVDMSTWADGEYCLVVNPREQTGELDLRETRTFILDNPEPPVCDGSNLLGNPSFEEPEVTATRKWDLVDPIDWIVKAVNGGADSQMELQRGVFGWTSSDGAQHTELGTDKAVVLSQTIPTIAGREYTLAWDYSPRPGKAWSESRMEVFVNDTEVMVNQIEGLELSNPDWMSYEFSFIGDGNDVTVSFKDGTASNGTGPLLDNTSLTCARPAALSVIDGYKWHDENQDGIWDEGEDPVEGWTIYAEYGESFYSAVTDENGYYYMEVPAGFYEVYEATDDAWEQTAAVQNGEVHLVSGEATAASCYFAPSMSDLDIAAYSQDEWTYDDNEGEYNCNFGNYELPVVTCDLSVSSESVLSGSNVTLTWNGGDALAVRIDDGSGVLSSDISGSTDVAVSANTTFTMTVTDTNEEESTCTASVETFTNSGGGSTSLASVDSGPTPQVLGASTSQCSIYLNDYMKLGHTNVSEVVKLQSFLRNELASDLLLTGTFGTATDAAVRVFQSKYTNDVLQPWVDAGLMDAATPTGYVYKTTRWKINNIVCPGSEAFPVIE